jgi:hypothetical protein
MDTARQKRRFCVVTIAIGANYELLATLTHPRIKAYADKIDSDFLVWKDLGTHTIAGYRKLDIAALLEDYDRVLYVDTDILIRPDAPNIFDVVPEAQLGLFEEGRFSDRKGSFYEFGQLVGDSCEGWLGRYYNTGVIVASKAHIKAFTQPIREFNNYYEQTCINYNVYKHQVPTFELHYKWNRMSLVDKVTGDPRHNSYFIHYAGAFYQLQGRPDPARELLSVMMSDAHKWEVDFPNYKYPQNIAVMITGGLGDQIAGEPVARYVATKMYKGDNVFILSHYPELFSHLSDYATIAKHGDIIENANNFYEMYTLTKFGHPIWSHIGHTLTQATDYASISALRKQLPINERSIQLPDFSDVENPVRLHTKDDYVVIHAGKGWPSKTIPVDIWQSYIDILTSNQIQVVLIGKTIEDNQESGYLNIDGTKCIDLRDQANLKELVRIIKETKILLTNDSGPLHIAGASDCYIGVFATCKSPDYILPYRNTNQYYKASNLTILPIWDTYNSKVNLLENTEIYNCPIELIRSAMPSNLDIYNWVKDRIKTTEPK